MNIRKTLILGIVLLVATLYLTKVSEPNRRIASENSRPFNEVAFGDFSRIRIQLEEGVVPYTLVKRDRSGNKIDIGSVESTDGWAIMELPGASIDGGGLNGVTNALRTLSLEGPLNEKKLSRDFSVYGLDKPRLTVIVEAPSHEKMEVTFGKKSEYLQQRYGMVSGRSGVYLIDEEAFAALNKTSQDIRSKTPLSVIEADVREVEIQSPSGLVSFSQPTVGEWRITKPASYEASAKVVSEFLTSVRTLQVSEFIDDADGKLGDFGLGAPIVKLSIKQRQGTVMPSLEASFGTGKDGASYFTYSGSPSVFKASADVSAALSKTVSDLREKRLWKLTGSEFERVVSKGSADNAVDIRATSVDWSVNGKVSDAVFVEQLLNDIAQLEAHSFATRVPVDAFAAPFLVLTLTKKGPTPDTLVLTIGKETRVGQETLRYARVGTSEEVVLLRDVEAKRIVPHEGALTERSSPSGDATPNA